MESEESLTIFQMTLGGLHQRLGTITLRDEKLNYSSARVQRVIESLRSTHFSSKTTDAEIYDKLPLILRGLTYCRGIEASSE